MPREIKPVLPDFWGLVVQASTTSCETAKFRNSPHFCPKSPHFLLPGVQFFGRISCWKNFGIDESIRSCPGLGKFGLRLSFAYPFGDRSLKCSIIGDSRFLPKNFVDGTVVAFWTIADIGRGVMDRPPESLTSKGISSLRSRRFVLPFGGAALNGPSLAWT